MAATLPLVSEEQYLQTSYRPDCDYNNGVVEERNLGTYEHSTLQGAVLFSLSKRELEWGVLVRPELRLKVGPRKYRVPDIQVLSADRKHPPVIETAPLLCIEIVSPDDRLGRITERALDYLTLGVPETWILDPETKRAYVYSREGLHEMNLEVLRCGRIELNLNEVFSKLG